ncbi:DUF4328 domain-containing protein [Nonomuraea sp. SMC257]|uniref:DUF4328 domain-containing protein n=1 Tax=Nonomuraea montanisoli TaxID=2741721 RepID=A0A7Y6IEY9_9ACTN|nr:DUF4328 domain-containing protein [Nonomuraea montanisoli]
MSLSKEQTIFIGVGLVVGWLIWFARVRAVAERLAPGQLRYRESMAVIGWFVPVGNLFLPKQIAAAGHLPDLASLLDPMDGGGQCKDFRRGPALLVRVRVAGLDQSGPAGAGCADDGRGGSLCPPADRHAGGQTRRATAHPRPGGVNGPGAGSGWFGEPPSVRVLYLCATPAHSTGRERGCHGLGAEKRSGLEAHVPARLCRDVPPGHRLQPSTRGRQQSEATERA